METYELMIGDWVQLSTPKGNKTVKVDSVGVLIGVEGSTAQHSIRKIKPIPLTREILEGTGFFMFRNCVGGGEAFTSLGVLLVNGYIFDDKDDTIRVRVTRQNKYGCIYNEIDVVIRYVHELQQALRLAGYGPKEMDIWKF